MADIRQSRYEEPLAFDDRRAPAPGPRRGPAPFTLILSVLVLLGVGGGVAYLYRDGVRGADGPPRPVGAPLRDVRTIAPAHAEEADPAAGLSIYKSDPNDNAAPQFAPPPEQPVQRVVAAAPVAAAPVAPSVATAPAATLDKPLTIDKIIAQADATPTRTPARAETVAKTADATKAVDAPKPAVKAIIQIGAFSTEALADKSFAEAMKLGGGKMSGKSMRVVPIVKDDATLYRVAVTGFNSRDDAEAVCAKLKAAGKSCFVR